MDLNNTLQTIQEMAVKAAGAELLEVKDPRKVLVVHNGTIEERTVPPPPRKHQLDALDDLISLAKDADRDTDVSQTDIWHNEKQVVPLDRAILPHKQADDQSFQAEQDNQQPILVTVHNRGEAGEHQSCKAEKNVILLRLDEASRPKKAGCQRNRAFGDQVRNIHRTGVPAGGFLMDSGIAMFSRFIERRKTNDGIRRFLTVALLLSDDERLWRFAEKNQLLPVIDEHLMDDILQDADVHEIGQLLWSRFGRLFSAELFVRTFNRLAPEAAADPTLLHQLVGAAVDFLRYHPGKMQISHDMARQLLNSTDCEHRVIGLKALCRHCVVDAHELNTRIVMALSSETWYERTGGIHELWTILEEAPARLSALTEEELSNLIAVLTGIAKARGKDAAHLKPGAKNCLALLATMIGERDK